MGLNKSQHSAKCEVYMIFLFLSYADFPRLLLNTSLFIDS